jgi:hypothetical protein
MVRKLAEMPAFLIVRSTIGAVRTKPVRVPQIGPSQKA